MKNSTEIVMELPLKGYFLNPEAYIRVFTYADKNTYHTVF